MPMRTHGVGGGGGLEKQSVSLMGLNWCVGVAVGQRCWPPGHWDPLLTVVAACRKFLRENLDEEERDRAAREAAEAKAAQEFDGHDAFGNPTWEVREGSLDPRLASCTGTACTHRCVTAVVLAVPPVAGFLP